MESSKILVQIIQLLICKFKSSKAKYFDPIQN